MQRILLTGASGFLGTQVLKALNNNDVSIKVVTRGTRHNFFDKYNGVKEIVNTNDFFTENFEWYRNICKDIDIVIHVAWYAEPGKYLESDLNLECLSGTLSFAKAAADCGVKKFVGVGTCFEYDLTSSKLLDTDSPLNPQSLYSAAKASTFLTLSKFFKNKKIDFLWNRVFYLFGEGEDERRLFAVLKKKLSKGETVDLTSGNQVRDFLNVEIAGLLIVKSALGSNIGPFNVCSGEAKSIREIAEKIADKYGRRDLLNFGARLDNLSDAQFVVGVPTKIS